MSSPSSFDLLVGSPIAEPASFSPHKHMHTLYEDSSDQVSALERRVVEYEEMLGAASLAQKKYIARIGALEQKLAETHAKKKAAASTPETSPVAAAPVAPVSAAPPTAAAHLASQFAYPAQFEANLAMFLADHTVDVEPVPNAEDERWGWVDFPSSRRSGSPTSAAQSLTRTLPGVTVDKLVKLNITQPPPTLFACPRLCIGLDMNFAQMHSLMYLQAVATMQMQMP